MKIILTILFFATSASAGEWKLISSTDTDFIYEAQEGIVFSPPNVVSLIKTIDRKNGMGSLLEITFMCNEWRAVGIDYEPMLKNKVSSVYVPPHVSKMDIRKGDVLADMFNRYCSMLAQEVKK